MYELPVALRLRVAADELAEPITRILVNCAPDGTDYGLPLCRRIRFRLSRASAACCVPEVCFLKFGKEASALAFWRSNLGSTTAGADALFFAAFRVFIGPKGAGFFEMFLIGCTSGLSSNFDKSKQL